MTTKTAVLQSTAKVPASPVPPRERVGRYYAAEQFKRELARAVMALCLPESKSLPTAVQMIIKLPEASIRIELERTPRGWKCKEKD